MSLDTLLWGFARPLIRIGTNRYVFNQPTSEHDIKFPKRIILNESSLTGYLNEHLIGNRGIFTINMDMLDRPSCKVLIDILNSSSDKYIRPHLNFWKEYLMRCVNGWELDRMGKVNKPYKGILIFETKPLETAIPDESSGSFDFDGSTKIAKTGLTITGNITVEFWLKTPPTISTKDRIARLYAASGPEWHVWLLADGKLEFETDDGSSHSITTTDSLEADTWYHIMVRRVGTDEKRIVVDSSGWATGSDSKAANDINQAQLGGTSGNIFDGLIQIFRLYSENVWEKFNEYAIEAIPSAYVDDIEIWWDFSQGNTDDLSGNGNNGTVTGTEQYYEESFPDKGYEIIT